MTVRDALRACVWVPACAGMTVGGGDDGGAGMTGEGVDLCGLCGLMGGMVDDADNAGAEGVAQTRPQVAGGAGKSGGVAPVFVENINEYSRHIFSVHAPACGKWMVYARNFALFAVAYALACAFAGWLFPQVYQSWLGWLAPLTEFVGGLTPRAERITGELIANGYPQRADDAVHGIAMARVFALPVVVCLLMIVVNVAKMPPLAVACSRRLRKELLLPYYAACPFLVVLLCYWEFFAGEDFGADGPVAAHFLHKYHRGDHAIVAEVFFTLLQWGGLVLSMVLVLMMCTTRFNITVQHEDKKS